MEKLTIKELAGYLPYGINCIHNHNEYEITIEDRMDSESMTLEEFFDTNSKIILRPLSDLTKEITYNGETFVPIEEIKRLGLGSLPRSLDYKWLYYHQIEKFFEWKFDVFGLIEKGLAISVEDLEENPYK